MTAFEAKTLGEAVRAAAEQFDGASFFLWEGEDYSRDEVDRRSDEAAGGLAALGVLRGDHVALMMPNRPEWVFTWLGVAKLGGVLIPVNTSLRGEGLLRILDHSDATFLVAAEEAREQVQEIRDQFRHIEHIVAQGGDELWGDSAFAELASHRDRPPRPELDPGDDLEIIYTSGTTGLPKGVMTAHGNALDSSRGMAMLQGLEPGKTVYCVLPFYHSAAQFVCFVAAMISGARVVIVPRFSASRFWDDVRRYQATSFNYYGAMLTILARRPETPEDRDNPVEICFGAAAPPEVWEDFERRFGVTIIEAFGQTEGGALMNPPGSGKIGSMGVAVAGWEARIVDDDDNVLGPGELGELVFKPGGERTMPEYYKDPEATAALTRAGWLHTGDLATIDDDGFFWYVDRKSDFMRRRGQNISCVEVEGVARQFPGLADIAAYGIRSELGEDDVAVAIVPDPAVEIDPAELIAFCSERMAGTQVPRFVRVIDEIPRTHATARAQRHKLREEGVTPDTWDRDSA